MVLEGFWSAMVEKQWCWKQLSLQWCKTNRVGDDRLGTSPKSFPSKHKEVNGQERQKSKPQREKSQF